MCRAAECVMLGQVTLRCLIVDDNPRVLGAVRGLLEREGIVVVGVASNAADALRAAETLHPDVVLLDINLDGESGFDLARHFGSASVILISTHLARDYADLISASPAVGFLAKSELSAGEIRAIVSARPGT
jgi:DNA-binding NarL/FixJ family response regulator